MSYSLLEISDNQPFMCDWWGNLTSKQQNTILAVEALATIIIVSVGIYFANQTPDRMMTSMVHAPDGVMTSAVKGQINSVSSYNKKILDLIDELKKTYEQNGGYFTKEEYTKFFRLIEDFKNDPQIGTIGFPRRWHLVELDSRYHFMFEWRYSGHEVPPDWPTHVKPEGFESLIELLTEYLR